MAKAKKTEELQPIIIKKVIKKGGGHHGGAWKVAYADFVTAMMAFFLLLWLLNVVTEDARNVISNYFDPTHPKVSQNTSGAGGVMGGLSMTPKGSMKEENVPLTAPQATGAARTGVQLGQDGGKSSDTPTEDMNLEKLEEELRKEEDERFKQAKEELEKALKENPELAELAKHLLIDITPEGLRIQIIDQEGEPMFPLGSSDMYEKTKRLIALASKAIIELPNEISVRGHTDSYKYAPGAKYTNWELSADRANASRRELVYNNIDADKLANVMGKADREHLIAENPLDPQNRRITIMMLRETLEQAFQRGAFDQKQESGTTQPSAEDTDEQTEGKPDYEIKGYEKLPTINDKPLGTFQKTPGDVYFP